MEKTERAEKKLQFFADQPRLCGSEARVKAAPFAMIRALASRFRPLDEGILKKVALFVFHANNAAFDRIKERNALRVEGKSNF